MSKTMALWGVRSFVFAAALVLFRFAIIPAVLAIGSCARQQDLERQAGDACQMASQQAGHNYAQWYMGTIKDLGTNHYEVRCRWLDATRSAGSSLVVTNSGDIPDTVKFEVVP